VPQSSAAHAAFNARRSGRITQQQDEITMDSRRLYPSCLTLRMHTGFRRLFSERSKLDIQKRGE
jgi:hypothetical protein